MIRRFRWYRRARGGRWAKVTALMFGWTWTKLPDTSPERADEDWRDTGVAVYEAERAVRWALMDFVEIHKLATTPGSDPNVSNLEMIESAAATGAREMREQLVKIEEARCWTRTPTTSGSAHPAGGQSS